MLAARVGGAGLETSGTLVGMIVGMRVRRRDVVTRNGHSKESPNMHNWKVLHVVLFSQRRKRGGRASEGPVGVRAVQCGMAGGATRQGRTTPHGTCRSLPGSWRCGKRGYGRVPSHAQLPSGAEAVRDFRRWRKQVFFERMMRAE